MKTKNIVVLFFLLAIITINSSCSEHGCGLVSKDAELNFSFKFVDKNPNDSLYYKHMNITNIHTLNYPDSIADYRPQPTRIDFSMRNYKPLIGEHDMSFIIQWKYDDTDTLRINYNVEEIQGACYYNMSYLKVYFNGELIEINPYTGYEFFK